MHSRGASHGGGVGWEPGPSGQPGRTHPSVFIQTQRTATISDVKTPQGANTTQTSSWNAQAVFRQQARSTTQYGHVRPNAPRKIVRSGVLTSPSALRSAGSEPGGGKVPPKRPRK